MALIRNIAGAPVNIDDIGISLATAEEYDLSLETPRVVFTSDDLRARINASEIIVLDPLDNITALSISESLEVIDHYNESNFRSFGTDINQLTDVTSVGVIDGQILAWSNANQQFEPANASGASFQLEWRFDVSTAATQPAARRFRYNNATLSLVTQIYVNDESNSGIDASTLLNNLDPGDKVYIQQSSVADSAVLFTVTTVTDNTGWFTIEVTVDDDSGLLHANNSACLWILVFGIAGVGTDELVKVSPNDTTPGFLNGKLVSGTNITFIENNDGGDETLSIINDIVTIDDLGDVDTTTVVPSDEAHLVFDSVSGNWEPQNAAAATPSAQMFEIVFSNEAGVQDAWIGASGTPTDESPPVCGWNCRLAGLTFTNKKFGADTIIRIFRTAEGAAAATRTEVETWSITNARTARKTDYTDSLGGNFVEFFEGDKLSMYLERPGGGSTNPQGVTIICHFLIINFALGTEVIDNWAGNIPNP